jgi:S1-C subfamily serine protease
MPPVAPPPAVGAPQEAEAPTDSSRPGWHRSRRTWTAIAVLVLAAVALTTWRMTRDEGPEPITQADVNRAVKQGIDAARQQDAQQPPDAATAYNAIGPSLVTVTTERGGAADTEVALGAGVVINARGAVLTALHVVKGGQAITVRFADGTRSPAQILNAEPDKDIAVLSVDRLPQVVVPAVMGGTPAVGDAVFAVGNPLGLQSSLSAGVVSQTGRKIRSEDGTELEDLIQFDAAVNPGNSGGPLLNRGGQVVGFVPGLPNPSGLSYCVGWGFGAPTPAAGGAAGAPQQ